jgi:hypothetical protein
MPNLRIPLCGAGPGSPLEHGWFDGFDKLTAGRLTTSRGGQNGFSRIQEEYPVPTGRRRGGGGAVTCWLKLSLNPSARVRRDLFCFRTEGDNNGMQTIAVRTKIPASRTIKLTLPRTVPTGEAELLVVVEGHAPLTPQRATGERIRKSGLFGMWRRREDIGDSAAFARSLRARAEKRNG